MGRKTIVVTIDPARRLANSLGLKELSNKPASIPAAQFKKAGLEPGPLEAMMLDTKTTFDELVFRYAKDEDKAKRIVANRFYQAISGALSGTHEYMAMEKLYELWMADRYDMIVIDTPPTRNALDFIEAPKRMTSFLEGRLLRWFLLPAVSGGKGLFRIANFAAVSFLKVVQRIIGAKVLADTAEFFANFEGMYEGFKERAHAVFELLQQDVTRFVVVTAPTEQSVDEALFFASTLKDFGLPFAGVVVNRVHPVFDVPDLRGETNPVVDQLVRLSEGFDLVRKREERSLARLSKEIAQANWARVPYLTREVVDLKALKEVASMIFGPQ